MRFQALTLLAAILATGTWFSAQAQQGGYAPPGSYQQCCVNIRFNSSTQVLSATCYEDRRETGSRCENNLQVSACQPGTDIESIQCSLQCQALAGTWGQGGAVPKGSYQQSCHGWSVSNGILTAQCWNFKDGRIDWDKETLGKNTTMATLDLSQCGMDGDIENIRGELLCTKPASASNPTAVNNRAAPKPAPGTCKPGFVWRQAIPADHVCVTPQTRQQTAADNAAAPSRTNTQISVPRGQGYLCLQGFVWRQAVPTDYICVLPQARAQAAADNAAAPSRTY
jgi:hypothetical protein